MSWTYVGDTVSHYSLHYAQENFEDKILEGEIVGLFKNKTKPFNPKLAWAKIRSVYNNKEYLDIQYLNNLLIIGKNGFLDKYPQLFFLEGWPQRDTLILHDEEDKTGIYSMDSVEADNGLLKMRLLDVDSIDQTAIWKDEIMRYRQKNTIFKGFDDTQLRDNLLNDYVTKKLVEFYKNPYLTEDIEVQNPKYITIEVLLKEKS